MVDGPFRNFLGARGLSFGTTFWYGLGFRTYFTFFVWSSRLESEEACLNDSGSACKSGFRVSFWACGLDSGSHATGGI